MLKSGLVGSIAGEGLSSAVFGMRGEGIVARAEDGYSSQAGTASGCRSREGSELGQVGRSRRGALLSQGAHGRHVSVKGTAEVGCRSLGLSQRWGGRCSCGRRAMSRGPRSRGEILSKMVGFWAFLVARW